MRLVSLGDNPKPYGICGRGPRRATAFHLDQHDLEVAPLRSADRLSVLVLPWHRSVLSGPPEANESPRRHWRRTQYVLPNAHSCGSRVCRGMVFPVSY